MNYDQITALAREFAEERAKDMDIKGVSINLDILQSNMENHLRWLLRRYCLVEKNKVCEAYKDAQKDQYNSEGGLRSALAGRNRSAVLVDLFPEIAKEVEE